MKYSETIKEELLKKCQQWVEEKITTARTAMNFAQEAANSEEKSSAGDKYETGRAMAQNERDQAAQQLEEALVWKKVLDQIDIHHHPLKPVLGSLVFTDKQVFFLSISAGKLVVDHQEYLAVSVQSPVGKLLRETSKGQSFTINKQVYTVVDVK